jgi:Lipid A core - O-antigen ligase and related enzymes
MLANTTLVANEWYYLSLLPAVLFVIYLAFVSLDRLVYVVVFLVPISVPLEEYVSSLGFNVQLPTEPILVAILFLFFFKLIRERSFDREVLLHPVSLAIYFNLFWMLITAITSTMPIVSFKFIISRLWFLATFYFIATQLFTNKTNIRRYVWVFMPMLMVVIGYAFVHMAQAGFLNQQKAHLSAHPFFNDHTSYGCILAMVLPFMVGFALNRKFSVPLLLLSRILVVILLAALLLSYSRAAWISIFIASGVAIIMLLKIKFRTILLFSLVAGALVYSFRTEIFMDLEHNKQNSSKDLAQHIQSISNIRTDDSNVERLNRWKSAFRMFKEKPVLGWGPGTYMFNYAPFQLYKDKTSISTNRGDRGNAHSEYIGPLAESGILGALSFILIGIITLTTGIRLYSRAEGHWQTKSLIFAAVLGLITYYTHGALNDFLDTDKASCLFWGYTAMIVSLDVYHVKKAKTAELPTL